MKYLLTISTKKLFRKPIVEMFKGAWKNEEEVKRIVAKYRPNALIINIEEIQVLSSWFGELGEKKE